MRLRPSRLWHPRLVVRRGKGGGVSSPTSTAGYVLIGGIATALSAGFIAAAFSGKPLMLVGLLITGVFLRDTWAWFAATPAEREEFRRQVVERGGGPDQTRIGQNWSPWVLVALAVVSATCFALVRRHVMFFPVGMMVGAVVIAGILDVVRAWWQKRTGQPRDVHSQPERSGAEVPAQSASASPGKPHWSRTFGPFLVGAFVLGTVGLPFARQVWESFPAQRVVDCRTYQSHGWHQRARLADGREVELPDDAYSTSQCGEPPCRVRGATIEKVRGEDGVRINGVLHSYRSSSQAAFGIAFGLFAVDVGVVRWRRQAVVRVGSTKAAGS